MGDDAPWDGAVDDDAMASSDLRHTRNWGVARGRVTGAVL